MKFPFTHLKWIPKIHLSVVDLGRSFSTYLIFAGIFYYFCAQIAAFDRSQVLLIALPITGIFVEHVWGTCLCLRLNNRIPKLLSFYNFANTTLFLITERQS